MNYLLADFAKCQLNLLANTFPELPTIYSSELQNILSRQRSAEAIANISTWMAYQTTSLYTLKGLSQSVGVELIWCKDESTRFGLGSFKALGGAYAVYRQLVRIIQQKTGVATVTSSDLQSGKYHELISNVTVTTATSGNHGRSVAWGAKQFGCHCLVYIHEGVSKGREQQIAAYDAQVIRITGTYDDSVRLAAAETERHGWLLISDTSYPGYLDIPRDVMHGYTVMVEEALCQLPQGLRPTHVFLQAGVGTLAAAVAGYLWETWGEKRPILVVVEPELSACLFESNRQGKLTEISGDLNTLMACLSAGVPSLLAWKILQQAADFFLTIPDTAAANCMQILAQGVGGDPPIVAGEAGVAGAAGLLAALTHPEVKYQLQLNSASRILLFNTEGATDPDIYRMIVSR